MVGARGETIRFTTLTWLVLGVMCMGAVASASTTQGSTPGAQTSESLLFQTPGAESLRGESGYWNNFYTVTGYTGGTGSSKWYTLNHPWSDSRPLKVTITGPSYTYTHSNLDLRVYRKIGTKKTLVGCSEKRMTSNEAVSWTAPPVSFFAIEVHADYIGSYQSRPAYAREFTLRYYEWKTS